MFLFLRVTVSRFFVTSRRGVCFSCCVWIFLLSPCLCVFVSFLLSPSVVRCFLIAISSHLRVSESFFLRLSQFLLFSLLSVFLFLCLFLAISASLNFCLCVSLHFSSYIRVFVSACSRAYISWWLRIIISSCICVCVFLYLHMYVSFEYSFLCLCVSLCLCAFVFPCLASERLRLCMPSCVHVSVCLFLGVSVYLCLSIPVFSCDDVCLVFCDVLLTFYYISVCACLRVYSVCLLSLRVRFLHLDVVESACLRKAWLRSFVSLCPSSRHFSVSLFFHIFASSCIFLAEYSCRDIFVFPCLLVSAYPCFYLFVFVSSCLRFFFYSRVSVSSFFFFMSSHIHLYVVQRWCVSLSLSLLLSVFFLMFSFFHVSVPPCLGFAQFLCYSVDL